MLETKPAGQFTFGSILSDANLAARICADRWGVLGRVRPLGAEKDAIFRVDSQGRSYVLRFAHPGLSEDAVHLQVAAAEHASAHAAAPDLPRPIPDGQGETLVQVPLDEGETTLATLSTWVDGALMIDTSRTAEQAVSLGTTIGLLNRSLASFDHESGNRYLNWDLQHCEDISPILSSIADKHERSLVESAVERFASATSSCLAKLPSQIIHSDATPYNVLVDHHNPNRVCGIIDFGDVVKTARVCDVAIAACYLLGRGQAAMELPVCVVKGFHAIVPLSAEEIELIPSLIEARHAMTAAITIEHAIRNPANAPSITKNTQVALNGLKQLSQQPTEFWVDQLLASLE